MTVPAALAVARATAAVARGGLPAAVAGAARLHLLDALGVGLAASALPGNAAWTAAVAATAGGTGPCSVLGRAGGGAPAAAALLNGAFIHALEYDDTHIASVVHGSAVAAPAALAAAQAAGAPGARLLAGYAIGWEVMIRLGLAAPGAWQARGFQVTAAAGSVGAAAAASCVAALDEGRTVAALGIAGSQASGLLEFLADGSTVKALLPGWAAHGGVIAAALAGAGMTGPATVLDGRFGVLAALAGRPEGAADLARLCADLGERWYLPEAAFKLYPCCHYIHPFLEALEQLIAAGLTADDVGSILCHVPPPVAPLIAEPWARRQAPVSGYDAKWALPWCLAARLQSGPLTVERFALPPDPAATALAGRIAPVAMADHGFPARFAARLTVTLRDGSVRDVTVPNVRGAPDRPVPDEPVRAKFRANAARALPDAAIRTLEDAVLAIEAPDAPAALARALAAATG